MELFKENHFPILRELQEQGLIESMTASFPIHHASEEGLKLIPHDFVKERLFGLVTCVAVDGEESIGTASNRSGALPIILIVRSRLRDL